MYTVHRQLESRRRGQKAGHVQHGKVRGCGEEVAGKGAARRRVVGLADVEVRQIIQAVCREDGEHRAYCQVAADRNARLRQSPVNINC